MSGDLANTDGATEDLARKHAFVRRMLVAFATTWLLVGLLVDQSTFFWRWIATQTREVPAHARVARFDSQVRLLRPGQIRVLVLGSSVAGHDIDRRTIARGLGLARNQIDLAAIPGAQAAEIAMLGSKVVDLRPDLVLHPINVWALDGEIELEEIRAYAIGDAWRFFGPAHILANLEFHLSRMFLKTNPIFEYRQVVTRLLLESDAYRDSNSAFYKAQEIEINQQRRERDASPFSRFDCGGIQVRALAYLAQQLDAAGIRLVATYVPANDGWGQQARLVKKMDRCLGELATVEPFVYLDSKVAGRFGKRDFHDHMHLTNEAAQRYSERLVPHLRALPGWQPSGQRRGRP